SRQILPCPLHLLRELLHFPQRQVMLGLTYNPERPLRLGWVSGTAKDIDLLGLTVPLLPRALQHPYLPAELTLQYIVQHDIGNILNIAPHGIAESPHLPGEPLERCLGARLCRRQFLDARLGARLRLR